MFNDPCAIANAYENKPDARNNSLANNSTNWLCHALCSAPLCIRRSKSITSNLPLSLTGIPKKAKKLGWMLSSCSVQIRTRTTSFALFYSFQGSLLAQHVHVCRSRATCSLYFFLFPSRTATRESAKKGFIGCAKSHFSNKSERYRLSLLLALSAGHFSASSMCSAGKLVIQRVEHIGRWGLKRGGNRLQGSRSSSRWYNDFEKSVTMRVDLFERVYIYMSASVPAALGGWGKSERENKLARAAGSNAPLGGSFRNVIMIARSSR